MSAAELLRALVRKVAFGFAVAVIVSPAILVFLWMLSLSLKPDIETLDYPPSLLPETPTLENFIAVFRDSPFLRYTINSIVVSFSATSAPNRGPTETSMPSSSASSRASAAASVSPGLTLPPGNSHRPASSGGRAMKSHPSSLK